MKKIITLFFGIIGMLNVANAQDVMLFDFDTVNANVTFVEIWNGTYPNSTFAKVTNPDASGINTSANVGQITSNGGVNTQVDSEAVGSSTLPAFDFATNPYLTMKVWIDKPVSVSVEFKNDGYYPSFGTLTQNVTTINQWVTVEFDCSEFLSGGVHGWGTYNIIGVSFDRDSSGGTVANDVYYFDDIKLSSSTTLSTKDFFASSSSAKYYPNPASDYIYVKNAQKVSIIDMNGRLVKEAVNLEKVDISSLVNGFYIVKLDAGNVKKTSKLIKN
jgi:hypothetical protein